MNFSKEITDWYFNNKRDLPWRNTRDPYKIWLSEIILQQTKVEQGLPYYLKFCDTFPTIKDLANADEQTVLKLWQGLGYYSRARNLHFTSKQIIKNHNGTFPKTYKEIIALKGVGEYTAAAISSFAYNLPYAVVDGNVFRVLSRYFGIKTAINSGKGKKIFNELAQNLLDENSPDIHNQAIMEFGAIQCKPKNPNCNECCLKDNCIAMNENIQSTLPYKIKSAKTKQLYIEYFYMQFDSGTFIKKRVESGIWKNLYEFPNLEFSSKQTDNTIINEIVKNKWINKGKFKIEAISQEYIHLLSHRKIHARIWKIRCDEKPNVQKWNSIVLSQFNNYPMSKLMESLLKSSIFKKQ